MGQLRLVQAGPRAPRFSTRSGCHLASALSSHELLKSFSKTEEVFSPSQCFTPEDIDHFCSNHSHLSEGSYQVSMPRKPDHQPMGESRTQVVRRFYSNESSMRYRGSWKEFQDVVEDYITLGHAEPMSPIDLIKPSCSTYYLLLHAILRRIAPQQAKGCLWCFS